MTCGSKATHTPQPPTPPLQAKAHELGSYLQAEFKGLMATHKLIGDVRGLGMMLGIELVTDRWVVVCG